MELNQSLRKVRNWQYFWPISCLIVIGSVQILLTINVVGLEIANMILNMKYSFFFIGFMASFVFILTWILIFIDVCCCRRSQGCATCTMIVHILSIGASIVLLFYDARFLHEPSTCLWSNNFCNDTQLDFKLFGLPLDTSSNINEIKFTLIKIQMACVTVMIFTCVLFIVIYISTMIRMYQKNKIADIHTIIELGRIQQPPSPFWPDVPRDFPSSTEF